MGSTAAPRIAAFVTAVATAIVIIAVAIIPFLNPVWVSFEQGRAQADLWTGYTPAQLNEATGAILSDLVFGPPNFDVAVDSQPVLNPREQAQLPARTGRCTTMAAWARPPLPASPRS